MSGCGGMESLAMVASVRARVDAADWRDIMLEIEAAPKCRRVALMRQIAERGVAPFGTVRNKFYEYQRMGDAALIDRRRCRALTRRNPWMDAFMAYCEDDLNSSLGGYRRMMDDFRRGVAMSGGVGTWRDAWAAERPFCAAPAECPLDWTPAGASYANLMAAANADPAFRFSLAAARRGRKAAHRYIVPVLTTRVGLPVLAKVEYDDVWHNVDIMLGAKVCQPLEFAGYDVASGFKCSSLMKPRFERADGVRDNLKERQFRFLFAYDHIVRGFHRDGIEDVVEHGTTAIRQGVERQIKAIPGMGSLITIRRSGILSEQVHAGLFIGNGGGNFRMKALCEGAHNILHNREAHLEGNRGRDAERMHESRAALVKYEERLMAAAARLPEEFALRLESGLMTFEEYAAAFKRIEDALMDDPEHSLEGWDGKVVREWRLAPDSNDWRTDAELMAIGRDDPDGARAIAAVIGRDPRLRRTRAMSRREAYLEGVSGGDIVRVDEWYLPHFMDIEKDAVEVTVRDNGLIGIRDRMLYGRDELLFRAEVRNHAGWNQPLAPGRKALALHNPMMPGRLWLVDSADGHTLGICPQYARAAAYDRHAIEVAMGEQAKDLAAKVLPVRGRHQQAAEDRARRMATNLRVMKEAAAAGAAAHSAPTGAAATADELIGEPVKATSSADAYSLDELLSV